MLPSIFPLKAFLVPLAQNPWTYLVFGLVGFGFGYVLELSGFGNSKVLAAQFYFKNLTVLKVMFGAIITAMVLIFLSSAIGILDFNLVYVPETHLWPGIVGGLIMGVGFIVGGFCPGTALVSASTFKVDGIVFSLGALVGVWAFGETVQPYWDWWNNSGYYGRLTLMDAFHLPTGVVVLLVVLMALFMFWGGEKLEAKFGKRDLTKEPKNRIYGAAAIILVALIVLILGQPTNAEKWAKIAPEKQAALDQRTVQVHPGELLASLANKKLNIVMIDVRNEVDFNLYHLTGAQRIPLADLADITPWLLSQDSANTIVVLMGNGEQAATDAWKFLQTEGVPNVYILEGGINNWITVFAENEAGIQPLQGLAGKDQLAYAFDSALGDRYDSAHPKPYEWTTLEYTPRIQLKLNRGPSGGGCG